MVDQNSVTTPLLLPTQNDHASSPTTTSPNNGVVLRLLFLSFVVTLALWSSHEASKGFKVSIVNDLPRDSRPGQRFDLFYVSDDKATRVLLNASGFVEDLLYGDAAALAKKPVSHVTLRLGEGVSVRSSGEEENLFVVDLSPKVMEESDVDRAVKSAVLRGMARVWLWDNGAPREILSGVVEYIVMAGGFGGENSTTLNGGEDSDTMANIRCGRDHRSLGADWFVDKDPSIVAMMLGRCEEEEVGFIRRLNGAMRDGWDDRTVENALGKPAQVCLCVMDN